MAEKSFEYVLTVHPGQQDDASEQLRKLGLSAKFHLHGNSSFIYCTESQVRGIAAAKPYWLSEINRYLIIYQFYN